MRADKVCDSDEFDGIAMWNVTVCAGRLRSCQASVSNQALAVDLMSAPKTGIGIYKGICVITLDLQ